MTATDDDISSKQDHREDDALLESMSPWYKHLVQPCFWQTVAVMVLGFTVTWGGSIPLAFALPQIATPISPFMAEALTTSSSLDTTVDQFLRHIPPGFYGIRDINLLKTRLKETDMVLVDVREPTEYRAGHIEDAINIPLRTLAQNLDQIPKDRDVMLYCSSGYRTGMGVMALHLLGYDNVQGFPPSYQGWQQAE